MENEEQISSEPGVSTKKSRTPLIIAGALFVLGVGIFAFGRMQTSSTEPAVESAQDESSGAQDAPLEEKSHESKMEATGQTISMEAGAFYYSVKKIRAKKGEKITIIMTSADMMHDFNIDELGVKSEIAKSGETKTFEFTPDKTGEFEYYCSVGKHRENGQVGKIIIEE